MSNATPLTQRFITIPGTVYDMLGHDGGLAELFNDHSRFTEDISPEGISVAAKIAQARASLLLDQPFFGYLLSQFKITPVREGMAKFSADSSHLYFNTDYMGDLITYNTNWKGKIKFILMHLIVHLIFRHHLRVDNRIPKLWGKAVDLVTQQILLNISQDWMAPLDWEVPPLSRIPDEFLNRNAEDTYDLFIQAIQTEQEPQQQEEAGELESTDQQSQDDWSLQPDMQYAEEFEELFDLGINCDIDMVAQETPTSTELEEEYFEGLIRSAHSYSRHHGHIPGDIKRLVQQIAEPRMSWQGKLTQYLQRTITFDSSWSRPNKRLFGQGYYLPSRLKQNVSVGLAIDTSGSIQSEDLQIFLTESQQILQSLANTRVIIFDCDSKVQQVTTYETGENLAKHQFIGGGGTDFRPLFKHLDEYQLDVVVYFTDGYGKFPQIEPPVPTIWVLTSEVTPPFGEIIRYNFNDNIQLF